MTVNVRYNQYSTIKHFLEIILDVSVFAIEPVGLPILPMLFVLWPCERHVSSK